MSAVQSECLVELSGFDDLARLACALREYPQRIYSHEFGGTRVVSCGMALANTLLMFYAPMPGPGRYVSYQVEAGREVCGMAESTKANMRYAPVIHMESEVSPLVPKSENLTDRFHPVQVRDLGSLARLTYNPEIPDEQNLDLFALPRGDSWLMGYVTSIEMDDVYYVFNYVELESEPPSHFLKYRGNEGRDPEFTNTFDHGFSYLPIIKLKSDHPIFGLGDP